MNHEIDNKFMVIWNKNVEFKDFNDYVVQNIIIASKTKYKLKNKNSTIVFKILYLANWLHAWIHSFNPSKETLLETKFCAQQRIINFKSIDSWTGYGLKFFDTSGGIAEQLSRNA